MKLKENFKLPIEGLVLERYDGLLIVRSRDTMRVLSSAILNGGLRETRCLLNMTVPPMYDSSNPEEEILKVQVSLGIEDVVGMMTAADVGKAAVKCKSGVLVVATAGASNAATPGEHVTIWRNGTVNIFVIVENDLTDEALANCFITITEAKALAFRTLDIRSVNSGGPATGTTTDSIAVATLGNGEASRYASTATDIGRIMGELVYQSVVQNLVENNGVGIDRPVLKRALERKVAIEAHIQRIAEVSGHPIDYGMFKELMGKRLDDVSRNLYIAGMKMIDESLDSTKNGQSPSMAESLALIALSICERLGGDDPRSKLQSELGKGTYKNDIAGDPFFILTLGLVMGMMDGGT
ncbi:MAG: adenosylcobinamide amidohydrolase [Candidatus Methanofastidiosa archaeon]|nr:adenosylcobinamide amidohydrolase [Candidatus Methanofastidiosa archaeon]